MGIVMFESLSLSLSSNLLAAVLKNENDFFSKIEIEDIKAYIDTLVPKTRNGPSATEAGVMSYLAKLIRDELPKWRRLKFVHIPKKIAIQTRYTQLVSRLNEISKAKMDSKFINLKAEQKIDLVQELSKSISKQVGYQIIGTSTDDAINDADLFKTTRTHVLQGYFSDPQYGGNKNFSAWESIKHICHFNYTKQNPSCEKHDH